MPPLAWIVVIAVAILLLAGGGALAWRSPEVRAFLEDIEDLGWRGALRGVWGLMRDRRVPLVVRLLPVPLMIYLATPIDLIPDFVPVLGQADDVLLAAAALWVVLRYTPGAVVREHFRSRRDHADGRPPPPGV